MLNISICAIGKKKASPNNKIPGRASNRFSVRSFIQCGPPGAHGDRARCSILLVAQRGRVEPWFHADCKAVWRMAVGLPILGWGGRNPSEWGVPRTDC